MSFDAQGTPTALDAPSVLDQCAYDVCALLRESHVLRRDCNDRLYTADRMVVSN